MVMSPALTPVITGVFGGGPHLTFSNLKNSGVKSQNPGEKGQNSERKKQGEYREAHLFSGP